MLSNVVQEQNDDSKGNWSKGSAKMELCNISVNI